MSELINFSAQFVGQHKPFCVSQTSTKTQQQLLSLCFDQLLIKHQLISVSSNSILFSKKEIIICHHLKMAWMLSLNLGCRHLWMFSAPPLLHSGSAPHVQPHYFPLGNFISWQCTFSLTFKEKCRYKIMLLLNLRSLVSTVLSWV